MNVSLKDLIETGSFGPVRLGMSRIQVERSLGAPDHVGGTSRKYRKPSILKYGDIEFHFAASTECLFLIHLDEFDVPTGGRSINLDPWIIRRALLLVEAEKHLLESGIGYKVEEYELEDFAKQITAGVGVKLVFSGENLNLQALSYHMPQSTNAWSGLALSGPLFSLCGRAAQARCYSAGLEGCR